MNETSIAPTSLSMNQEGMLKWLMEEYGEDMFHLAYMMVKDRALAEDITQDVFIKAYRHLGNFRGDGNIKHWLYKITMNETRKHFRSWSFRHIWTIVDEKLGSLMDRQAQDHVEAQIEHKANQEETFQFVMSLAPKYRQIVILHYYEDLSFKEISQILSVTQEVVRTRLHRAKKQLKELISKEGER
ncbi:sigma-70 family RNA polymerase sigma factor [Brevibacillus formosus]|uniref:sigma-70 family RNA polymerase sigma factor n=1 Tax=Brevibacillus formosus TaxID=54913 RepID=UPI003F1D68E5